MGLLSLAIALYFAIGLALVFIGPAARMLRVERNRLRVDAPDRPGWKLAAFSGIFCARDNSGLAAFGLFRRQKRSLSEKSYDGLGCVKCTAAIQGADRTL